MNMGDAKPADRLCGSGSAHRACKFAGDRTEKPPHLGCNADDHHYGGCRYADTFGTWHLIWRREQDRFPVKD